MTRKYLSRFLLWWGGVVLTLVYVAGSIVSVADAYGRSGVAGAIAATVFLSAVPMIFLGIALRKD